MTRQDDGTKAIDGQKPIGEQNAEKRSYGECGHCGRDVPCRKHKTKCPYCGKALKAIGYRTGDS